MFNQRVFLPVMIGAMLFLGRPGAAQLNRAALPGSATRPGSASAACQWGYYAGGTGPFIPLLSDPDGTSPSLLRAGSFFRNAGALAHKGSLDFNQDGLSDIFRITLHQPDNLYYQWQNSSGATSN